MRGEPGLVCVSELTGGVLRSENALYLSAVGSTVITYVIRRRSGKWQLLITGASEPLLTFDTKVDVNAFRNAVRPSLALREKPDAAIRDTDFAQSASVVPLARRA